MLQRSRSGVCDLPANWSLHRLLDLKFRSRRIFEPASAPQSPFPGKREFEAREFGALELT